MLVILVIYVHHGVRADRRNAGRAVPERAIRYTSLSLPYHIG